MHKSDIVALLSLIVGLSVLASDALFASTLDKLFGAHTATAVLGALGLAGIVASQVLRSISNPSPPAGTTSVVAPSSPSGAVALANPGTTTPVTPAAATASAASTPAAGK